MRCSIWLLLVGIIVGAEAAVKRPGGKCKNKQFQRHTEDTYSYSASVQNGLLGTTDNITQMDLKATVTVTNDDGCEFFLKLADVTITEKIGGKTSDNSALNEFANRLTANGLRFTMEKGMVTSIKPSVQSTEPDVLNIQRGILSMLQVRLLGRYGRLKNDDDISGTCKTEYRTQEVQGQVHVEKIKYLDSCKEHRISFSNIDGVPLPNANGEEDPLLKSTSECSYRISKSKKGGLKSVICKEHFLVRPFSSELGAGAFVTSRSSLTKTGSERIKTWKIPYPLSYESTIKYDSSAHYKNAHKPSFVEKVTGMLNNMAANDFHESKFKSAEKFTELVASIRHLNSANIGAVMKSVDITKESVRTHLFDALAQCGTSDCLGVLFETLKTYKMLDQLPRLMSFIAFTKQPTPEVVRLLMGVRQEQNNPALALLISSLVYKMCQYRPNECAMETSVSARLVKDVEQDLLRLLGTDCRTQDKAKQNEIFYALKGIGNMGRPTDAFPLIYDCIKNAEHAYLSVAAIQALRRMKLTQENRNDLYDVLTNKNEHLEKRVELFLMLMKDPTDGEIILARDLSNADDESGQLRSLINSYLRSALKNTDPTQARITNKFQSVLQNHNLHEFNPSSTRYSKAFTQSADFYGVGNTASGMSLFHPESFVPRTVNLNLTTRMFGYSINPLEINARMEGMESVLQKYLGKDGYLGPSYMKKLFDIPKINKERKRRSTNRDPEYDDIDSQVNMKYVPPQAMISLKVFGNEIQILSLDDLPFLKGELGDRNIIKDLYDLTKGKQTTYKKNLILLEVSQDVPTMIGLPLQVAVNVSAALTVDMKGKVTTNILFGPKAATIEGSLKPSVSIHAAGKLTTSVPGISKIGTSFEANMHTAKEWSGKIGYEEGKDVEFDIKADKDVNDVMNISYNIFHMTSSQRQPITGVEKRAKGYFCTGDYMDVAAAFGVNTCMEMSMPLSYYNLSVPHFPLSGPFNLGIRNYPVDPLLSTYRMLLKKTDELYTFVISTPGSSYDRRYEVNVGADTTGSWTLGFSHGEARKGVMLSTGYDKATNEMKAQFKSNLTELPMHAEIRFFNETDQETFERKIGGAVKLNVGGFYTDHSIYFKDTYDYVAVGGRFEYLRGEVASLELKVQYEPQMFSLTFDHTPTNSRLVAYGMPNIFLLKGGFTFTTGNRGFKKSANAVLNMINYTMDAYYKVEPHFADYKLHAYLDEGKKMFKVIVLQETWEIFNWEGSLKDVGHNFVENVFKVADQVIKMDSKWSSKMNAGSIQMPNFNAGYSSSLDIKADGYNETGKINWNGTSVTYQYTIENTNSKTEACVDGTVMVKSKFGHCIEKYIGPNKKGYVTKVKNEDGKWMQPYSLLMKTSPDGSVEASLKYSPYLNVIYERKPGKELSFYVTIMDFFTTLTVKEEAGKQRKHMALKYANLFDMQVDYNEDENGKDIYNLKFTKDEVKVHLRSILKTIGESFSYTFGHDIRAPAPFKDIIFNVVMKDKLYNGDDDKMYRSDMDFESADVIMDFDTKGDYLSTFEYRPTRGDMFNIIQPHKFIDEISDKGYKSTFMMKPKQGGEFQEKFMYFFDITNKKHQLKFPVDDLMKLFYGFLDSQTAPFKQGLPIIGQVIGLDPNTIQKIGYIIKNGSKEYFMTFECNGEEIKNKFFTKSNIDMLHSAFIKTVFFPFTEQFIAMVKDMDGSYKADLKALAGNLDKIRGVLDKSILSYTMTSIKNAITKYVPTEYQPLLPVKEILEDFSKTFENVDVFSTKVVEYLQRLVDALQNTYMQRIQGVDMKEEFSVIQKYIPGNIKVKFVKILKKTVTVLQTWKYNVSLTPLQNIKYLLKKLSDADLQKILVFDHENILVKALFQHIKFPGKIKTAVLEFAKNSNYIKLFTRLTRFVLTKYKVKGEVETHVQNLMDSKTFEEFTDKFSKLEFDTVDIPTNLFSQLKTLLKEEYKIPVAVLDIIDELFTKADIKSFNLRDLPVMLVSNKIPNVMRKFIQFLKDSDLTDYLVRIIKVVAPELTDSVEKFLKMVEGTDSLNKVVLGTYKLIINSVEQFVDFDDMDTDVLKFVTKYMEMMLSDEDTALQMKNMLLDAYDKTKKQLDELYPSVMSRLGDLPSKVRIHLANIDASLLKQNTSLALIQFFNGVFKDVVKFVDTAFRAGLQVKVAEVPKLIMSKLLRNDTFLKDYDMGWEQLNLIYDTATTFLDDMINSGNGSFSVVAFVKTIMERVKAGSENDAISALVDNFDITKYGDLTYDTFLAGMKKFLNDLGAIKSGDKTINEHVRSFILEIRDMMKDAHERVREVLQRMKNSQGEFKQSIRTTFTTVREYIKIVDKKENKLIKFVIDSLVPGIDGLSLLMKNEGDRICEMSFLGSYGLETLPPHLEENLNRYRASVSCDLMKLPYDILNMKKDQQFINNLVDKIEGILLKMIDENIQFIDNSGEMLKSIMVGTAIFKDTYDAKTGLGDMTFDVMKNTVTLIANIDMVQQIKSLIEQSTGSGKLTFKTLVEKYVLENLRKLPSLMAGSVKVVDDFGNKYILPVYSKMKAKFHNVTMVLNSAREFILDRISRFTNPENSDGYLKLLPEALAEKVKNSFDDYQNKVTSGIFMVENKIRKGYSQVIAMFEKYRVDIRKQITSLKNKVKMFLSNYLDMALAGFDKYTARLDAAFKPIMGEEWTKADLKGKFTILSKRTKQMRLKYTNIKKQFISDMENKILKKLSSVKWLHKKTKDIIVYFLQKITMDEPMATRVISILKKSIRQNVIDGITMVKKPMVRFLSFFDGKVCEIKKMAAQIFPNKDSVMQLNYNLYNQWLDNMMIKLTTERKDATLVKQSIDAMNVGKYNYGIISRGLKDTLEVGLQIYFESFVNSTKMETKVTQMFLNAYANYSDIPLDVLVKQLFAKYAMNINRTMLQINKALEMSPPAVIEGQIIRFLGLEYKPKPSLFQPLSRTAYLFDRSLVTFDGTPIFLPQDVNGQYSDCKFLLTRDFLWRNFTIYLYQGKFIVETKDAKVIVDRKNNNEVTVVSLMQPGFPTISEFPVQFFFTTVTKLSNVLKIKNVFGLEVQCQLDVFSCYVTVPGYYHNKTLGLFGTNNVEHSDDLKMPNGQNALNLVDFINAFELTSNSKCDITSPSSIINEVEAESKAPVCSGKFVQAIPEVSRFESIMQRSAFRKVCRVEDGCSISKAYVSHSKKEMGLAVPIQPSCDCKSDSRSLDFNSYFSSTKANLHITLIIKLVPEVSYAKAMMKKVLQYIGTKYSDKLSMQFTIVGFAGNRVYKEPHIQTSGGKVTYDVNGALSALDRLQFNGTENSNEKLGISALKFAAQTESTRGMKIFMLFENDASYTNLLQQLMDVSETLTKHGIILNVVNNYKMKPNVIAKDSHKTRYHLNLPEGEPFSHSVTFPRTDDYIPFIKQTGGAVFSLKAFTNDAPVWSKALPTTVAEVLRKQIDQDTQQCKKCTCNVCTNVAQENCDYGLLRGRRSQQ